MYKLVSLYKFVISFFFLGKNCPKKKTITENFRILYVTILSNIM